MLNGLAKSVHVAAHFSLLWQRAAGQVARAMPLLEHVDHLLLLQLQLEVLQELVRLLNWVRGPIHDLEVVDGVVHWLKVRVQNRI